MASPDLENLEARIDRDRRERERETLLLLLLLSGQARRYGYAAIRVGADPYAAIAAVLSGSQSLGLPGGASRLARLLLLAEARKRRHLMRQLTHHYRHLHLGVNHKFRELAAEMVRDSASVDLIADRAVVLCTEFRTGMGNLLDLHENDIHCSLKMYQPNADNSGRELVSWAVGRPRDQRPRRPPDAPSSTECTVHAALNGEYDGYNHWPRLTCFCCNDLKTIAGRFKCPRSEYLKWYKSTMTFAIRFVRDATNELFDDIGYLAFDSPRIGAFAGMPDAFDYIDKPDEYVTAINEAAAFHLGASYADQFATVMHGFYNPETHCAGDQHGRRITISVLPQPALPSPASTTLGKRPDSSVPN